MIPTKGMTLPLISYGGSSLLATGLTLGLILALTRKNLYPAPAFAHQPAQETM
jgi:cell division protein FtsW